VPGLGDQAFTRLTGTVRVYVPVASSLTLAARVLGEHVVGDMPLPMLADMGSSFGGFTGIGGAKSVRGVLRNRYVGRSRALGNLEVRWRGSPFTAVGQRWRFGVVAFADAGRVWHPDEANAGGLHWGRGGGLRITWGDAFIAALDFAHGGEAGLQTYVGLGHLF
jgi:outer membrane protein assembly factor BamA